MEDQFQEIIVCYSLVDLTKTDAVGSYKPGISGDPDAWNFSRNQQRNWETVVQLIGLRAQPVYLTDPVVLADVDLAGYQFSSEFQGLHTVWTFEFASEHARVFGNDLELLKLDAHNVPINIGLNETARFPTPVIDTQVHHNVYFCTKVVHK